MKKDLNTAEGIRDIREGLTNAMSLINRAVQRQN